MKLSCLVKNKFSLKKNRTLVFVIFYICNHNPKNVRVLLWLQIWRKTNTYVRFFFKLKFWLTKHESFIIFKVFKVKVVSIFHFDHFLDLEFETILGGTAIRSSTAKIFIWHKPVFKTLSKSQVVVIERFFLFK